MSDQSLILSLALKCFYGLRKWLQFSEVQYPPWQRRNNCSYFTVIFWGLNYSAPSLEHNWHSLTRRYFYSVTPNPMDVSQNFLFHHCLVKEDNRLIQRPHVILQDQGLTFPGLVARCLFHKILLESRLLFGSCHLAFFWFLDKDWHNVCWWAATLPHKDQVTVFFGGRELKKIQCPW